MQSGRHSFYCTLELSCPHDNLSAIPPATKVAGFLASFYEHAHVRGAGLSLRVAHVRGARNLEGLAYGNLRIAFVAVNEDGGTRARLVEELAAVRLGFFGRDLVDAVGALGNRAASREKDGEGGREGGVSS